MLANLVAGPLLLLQVEVCVMFTEVAGSLRPHSFKFRICDGEGCDHAGLKLFLDKMRGHSASVFRQ